MAFTFCFKTVVVVVIKTPSKTKKYKKHGYHR